MATNANIEASLTSHEDTTMKPILKPLLLLTLLLLPASLAAQEETLLGSGDIDNGGYGGPVVKVTMINNEFAVLVGGRGGWIINHTFVIGGAGYGLVNKIKSRIVGPFGERYVEFAYGGLDLEYIIDSDRLLHASIHALTGAGTVKYRGEWNDNYWSPDLANEDDAVFVFEPGFNLDLNVIQWFRLSAGVSYRYVRGATSGVASNKDLTGFAGGLTLRFGDF